MSTTMLRSSRPFAGCPRLARRAQAVRVRVASQRPSSAECSTSGSSDNLWWRALASIDASKAQPVAAVAMLMLGMAAGADPASATDLAMADAHAHAQPIAELAEQDLLSNLARYGRYFVTVMLGTGYVMLRPLQAMFKKPVTAVFGLVALGALLYGTRVALELMLGLDNSFSYDGDNFRIVTDYTQ